MIKNNKKIKLRYGENPSQRAYINKNTKKSIFEYQLSGKEISYNNIIDVDSGIRCMNEFKEPTCIIIKHTNPCGVSSANNISLAFKRAYESDNKSAFGGIVFLNRKVTHRLAKIISKNFFEVVCAPFFEIEALKELKKKRRLILLQIPKLLEEKIENRSTIFGDIFQTKDITPINIKFIKLVSQKKASKVEVEDILFSLKVAKHLKSNAVVLSNKKQTLGLGHGQTNRVDALKFALRNMRSNFKNKNFVCASDGFFPFIDSIKILKKNKCNVVAEPSGSINDEIIISYAKNNNLSLYFTKNRLFKH